MFTLDKHKSIGVPDQTFEIIMTKLDEDVMKIFTKDGSKDVHEATQVNTSLLKYFYQLFLSYLKFVYIRNLVLIKYFQMQN